MSKGFGEPPERSVYTHLQGLDYPVTREDIVASAEDNEAPVEVINFLRSLPQEEYQSLQQLERDFAEAAKRFAMGADKPAWAEGERGNIGRDAVERAAVKHP
jgi:hypothetical protein